MSTYKVQLPRSETIIVESDDAIIDDDGHLHLISGDPATPHHNGLFPKGEFDYVIEVKE